MRRSTNLVSVVLIGIVSILQFNIETAHAFSNSPGTVSAKTEPGTASATATWTSASGATKYQVQLRIGSSTGVAIRTSEVLSSTSRTMSFTGVEYNLDYVIGVRGGDSTGWGTYSFANAVTPIAAAPSPPSKPDVNSPADGQLTFAWNAPSNNGGAVISSYVVQLFLEDEISRAPVTTSGLTYTFKDLTSTSKYSANIKAVNSESKTSEPSELSDAKAPSKEVALALEVPAIAPSQGNGPSTGNTPSSGGNVNQPSGGGSNQASDIVASNPNTIQTPPNLVSPLPALLPYSKLVKLKSTTSKSTLSSLSKLAVPKGATTSFVISSSSKKYCSLRGTSVYMIKTGTCAITFTVKTKSGKKTARTVKLVVR